MADRPLPLADLTIIDISTVLAGPFAAQLLADFGARVIKVEHPSGDPMRRFGPAADGVPLWWKVLNRNKQGIVLNLSTPEGAAEFLRLAANADAVIENFRPGTLERWGIGPEKLKEVNPDLVVTRISAFGQDGPYSPRPGFGTLAEAMGGVAALQGGSSGPPVLPAYQLGDTLAGLYAACATLIALHARAHIGQGQTADVSITEAVISILGPLFAVYEKLGTKPTDPGPAPAGPRNVYRCKDGNWIAVSASVTSVAERVLRLVGRGDLADQPWFQHGTGRGAHRVEIDDAVSRWVADRDRDEVIAAFERAEAAAAPVYHIDDILQDPHFQARRTLVNAPDVDLGTIRMPNVAFRLSATPGQILRAGPRLGEHTEEILKPVANDEGSCGEE
ncbi:CaiB/BaiF CoA-transferase family protein [Frankia sp. R82]|uniref:CaiB/BaiF CoA transferase family protein n=1 Tax=Frankia sp. R82 TaxID=2950553 RepID=UPI0020446793|nr:CoA transferase [Frankia sp. R82]MCM3886691.1 CoA transferase [Frankia sp. R82]